MGIYHTYMVRTLLRFHLKVRFYVFQIQGFYNFRNHIPPSVIDTYDNAESGSNIP